MFLHPPKRSALLLALVLPLAGACKQPGRLDLLLRSSDDLDLTAVASIEVRLLEDATGAEVGRATVAGSDLAALPELLAKSELGPNVDYVFEVRATVDTGVCASGRVVGRSLPLSVESDTSTDSSTAYVACADGVAPTGRTNDVRTGHAAIWAPAEGGALLIGGASTLVTPGVNPTVTALASVDVYDVAAGQFSTAPPMHEARFLPGAALDAEGAVVVVGGVSDRVYTPEEWLDSVEELDGDERRLEGLTDGRWLEPRTLTLTDGTLAIMGLGVAVQGGGLPLLPYQVSFYDPRTQQVPHDAIETTFVNGIVVPFPGRGRALLAGGDAGPEPARPRLFCEAGQCGCDDGACLIELGDAADPDTWGPGPRWNDAAGAWLPCPEGGGTAYIVGGKTRPDGADREDIWGDVYCHRDTDEPDTGFVNVGELDEPRTGAGVVALRGGRLLVVGGYDDVAVGEASLPRGKASALILSVSACGCEGLAPGDVTEVPIDDSIGDIGHFLLGRSAVTLGDGTVLITGTASIDVDSVEAGSDAWVFNPDLP